MSCVDSLDWMESKTAEDIIDRVTLGLHPGAIILCHNNGTYTAEAINQIIPYAQQEGYQFVPVGELIYREGYQVNQQGMQIKPKAENNDKYKEECDDGDDHNVMRTYFRHGSKHFVCIISVKVSPPSHEAGIIITFADKETEPHRT